MKRKKSDLAWMPWVVIGSGTAVALALAGIILTSSPAKPEAKRAATDDAATDQPADRPAKVTTAGEAGKPAPVLLLGWSEDTRKGASVSIDGVEMVFPAVGRIALPLQPRPQPYRITLSRPGYEKIEFSCASTAGEPIEPYLVTWEQSPTTIAKAQASPAGHSAKKKHSPKPPRVVYLEPEITAQEPEKSNAGSGDKRENDSGKATEITKVVKAAETVKLEQSGLVVPASRPADTLPQDFLKSYGVVKSGRLWVLAAEKKLQTTLGEISVLKVELMRKRKAAMVSAKKQAEAQRAYDTANEQFTVYEQRYRRSFVTSSDVAMYNSLRARAMGLKTVADQASATADQSRAAVSTAGEPLGAKIAAELREYYDDAQRQYSTIVKSPAIARAVADYNRAEGDDLRLGPSSLFVGLADQIKGLEAEATAMSARIPIKRKGKLWFVRVEINDTKTIEMAIDTGAEVVSLPWKAAIQAGLDPDSGRSAVMESANGSRTLGHKLTIPKMAIDRITATDVECVVMPAANGDVTPLLGQTFLSKFNYHIDSGDGVLVISTAAEKARSGEKAAKRK